MNALLVADGDGEEFVRQGPGAYLKAAREERGWDITYIANAMHLDEETVKALEADDFESLTSPVFVLGYLRKYARLVDTPNEPLLRAYRDLCPQGQVEPRQDLRAAAGKPEIHSNHAFVRIISFVVLFLMLGLLVVWWRGYLQDAEPGFLQRAMERLSGGAASSSENSQPLTPALVDGPGVADGGEGQPFTYVSGGGDDVAGDDTEGGGDVASSDYVPPQEQPSDDQAVTEEPTEPATGSATAAAEEADLTAETVPSDDAANEEKTAPPAQVAAASARFRIDFYFDRTSWVDVRDGNGRLLIVGEKGGGRSQQLTSGKLPFNVVLGRADAVRVEVNGEPFNLSPHSRKNVARFKLTKGALGLD